MYLPLLFNAESLIRIVSLELWVHLLVFTLSCSVKSFCFETIYQKPLAFVPWKDTTYCGMALSVRLSVCPSVWLSARPSVRPSSIACERDILKTVYLIDFVF